MSSTEMFPILDQVINSVVPGPITENLLQKLQLFFPDSLLLAALDLIDRECVTKFTSPVGRKHIQVTGSTSRYSVFLDLIPGSPYSRFWCNCPAFSFSVLLSETHFMCKHVLASRLAQRMGRMVDRQISFDDWSELVSRQEIIQMH